jgi:hypothetical protein
MDWLLVVLGSASVQVGMLKWMRALTMDLPGVPGRLVVGVVRVKVGGMLGLLNANTRWIAGVSARSVSAGSDFV